MASDHLFRKGPPPKRYKVGEIMQHTDVSRQTIHNYTQLGLISPVETTPSGHRLYDESVFERLRLIAMLKVHRSLAEIRDGALDEAIATARANQEKRDAARQKGSDSDGATPSE